MSEPLKSPYPWYGGKRRAASVAWRAFGDVPNYVEPFFRVGAVLLGRPHEPKIETINDLDRFVANFWRAVTAAPLDVAAFADWPVNEADMHARHRWLVNHVEFRERMHTDPDYFDPKVAGWWVWGLCQWIGGGWCAEPNNRKHPKLDGIGKGVHSNAGHAPPRQLPKLSVTDGAPGIGGVHAAGATWKQRPAMSGDHQGMGVHAASLGRRPAMSSAGQGVHLPALGNDRGINGLSAPPCAEWFEALKRRLRRVRVACGDWPRVLGPSVLGKGKNVGGRRPCAVFLDPPYDDDLRARGIYNEDHGKVSARVREWAIENGDDPELRIALCGYEGEHEMPASWTTYAWKAARGYAGADNDNREKERIWFSPHCLPIDEQPSLFGGLA